METLPQHFCAFPELNNALEKVCIIGEPRHNLLFSRYASKQAFLFIKKVIMTREKARERNATVRL